MTNENNEEIARYLRGNTSLRDALGLSADACLKVEPLGKGEHNENYVFCEEGAPQRFVLRVNRVAQPFHTKQVAYEHAALRALEQSGCTPRALYCDASAVVPGNGVLVESFCPGSELDFDNLKPGDLQKVAHLMASVHAVPANESCGLYRPDDPLKQLFNECVDRFSVYRGTALEDARFTRWIERFFVETQKKIEASPDPDEDRHIINTETLPSHFLLLHDGGEESGAAAWSATAEPGAAADSGAAESASGASSGCAVAAGAGALAPSGGPGTFVDWERPILGEVAQDLAFFVAQSTTFWDSAYLFPHKDIQPFLDEYWRAVDGRFDKGAFEARFDAYLAVSVLRSQTWFCKNAARYAQGAGAHTVQRTFDKWDIYTSDEFNEMLLRECF